MTKVKLRNSKIKLDDPHNYGDHSGSKPVGWIHPSYPELLFFAFSHIALYSKELIVMTKDFTVVANIDGARLKDLREGNADLSELEQYKKEETKKETEKETEKEIYKAKVGDKVKSFDSSIRKNSGYTGTVVAIKNDNGIDFVVINANSRFKADGSLIPTEADMATLIMTPQNGTETSFGEILNCIEKIA